ncbi:MAG: flagellin [Lachnospirales bacterium]
MSNMVVNTNVLALNSHRSLKRTGEAQSKASARLSSGERINSAADDAAGLAISEKMRSQIRGLDMASKNAQDGVSLVQTAEGGLAEIDNMVQRIRELTVQSANDTNTTEDRSKIDLEIQALADEIGSMADRVEFNEKKLINGSAANVTFQVGANAEQTVTLTAPTNFKSMATVLKGLSTGGSSLTATAISKNLAKIDSQLTKVVEQRAKFGAMQNRLEFTQKSLDITSENLSASESRIRDTDMAKEMMALTKANVLQQASTNMLAQANQAPQNVLQLLQ